MSTLTPYWSDEVTRIKAALSAARLAGKTARDQWQKAREALRKASDLVQTRTVALAAVRKQLAGIPMPADGDPVLVQFSDALIALNEAQSTQAKADRDVQLRKAQSAQSDVREAALVADLTEAQAQLAQAVAQAADHLKVTDALSTGLWKTVATEATKALLDFAPTATARVELSFPSSDPALKYLLTRVRARRDLAKAWVQGDGDVAVDAYTASHDTLGLAQQAYDTAWRDVRAYFDLAQRWADDRLTLKALASLPAPNPPDTLPILTLAQHKRLHDPAKLGPRETTLALLKVVDDKEESLRVAQAAYDTAYNAAIAAKPDASLADLQAGDLKTVLKAVTDKTQERDDAHDLLWANVGHGELQAWLAAIPDTLLDALDQLDNAVSRLGKLKGPPVASDLLATLATKETELVTALGLARLAQRKQAAATRGWQASVDTLAVAQDTAVRLARAAARGTDLAL